MKRAVAVQGPTPQFVRWALNFACSFREIERSSLANSTFRQLRSLREVSRGHAGGRIVGGVCLHESASSQSPDEALGFFVDEITSLHGEVREIDNQCFRCPANSLSEQGIWAGCYGWLPVAEFSIGPKTNPETEWDGQVEPLVEAVELIANSDPWSSKIDSMFPAGKPSWYRLWQIGFPSTSQRVVLAGLFDQVVSELAARNVAAQLIEDTEQFCRAVRLSLENDLELFVELIPRGVADKSVWQVSDHCRHCKFARMDSDIDCPVCGQLGIEKGHKRKVLGNRPYLRLVELIGERETRQLLEAFEHRSD